MSDQSIIGNEGDQAVVKTVVLAGPVALGNLQSTIVSVNGKAAQAVSVIAGGGGAEIGQPVVGGTPDAVLFVDDSGDLGEDPTKFSYDKATEFFKVGGLLVDGIEKFIKIDQGLGFQRKLLNNSNYTPIDGDIIIHQTNLLASRTITLPLPGDEERIFIIKDGDGSAANFDLNIIVQSSRLIDGATTVTINTAFGVLRVYAKSTLDYVTW